MSDHHHDDDDGGHDAHGHPHAPTPAQDMALARRALEAGDVKHAAHHVACALGEDASNEEYLGFAHDLLSRVDDPLALTPLGAGEASYAIVAFRALTLSRLGDLNEAIDLVFQVLAVRPDVDYWSWIERWTRDDASLASIDSTRLASSLRKLVDGIERSASAARFSDATFERVHDWLVRVRPRIAPDSALVMMHAIMLRRAGRRDDALAVARAAHAANPDYRTAVAVAGACRALDDLDGAIAAFEEARRFDPTDVATLLDIGDIRLEQGRREDSLAAYRKALELEPENAWAFPSALYVAHLLGDNAARARLREYAALHPGNGRARELLGSVSPWVGYLPEPEEATLNVVRQIVETKPDAVRTAGSAPTVELRLSAPECPSAIASARDALRALNPTSVLDVTVERVPTPDPRVARGEPALVLWQFDDHVARPGVPAPPGDVATQIAGIASEPFAMAAWRSRARTTAEWLGAEAADAIAATMVHPPPAPDGITPWVWRQHVQVAAALVIAAIEDGDGWEGSTRARVLSDLLRGPIDWSVTAAVIAVTELALTHPKLETTLGNLLAELYEARPPFGYWCVAHPLLTSLLRLPGLPKEWRERLARELTELG